MDELTDNSCETCGFDASAWNESSKIDAIVHASARVEAALGGTDPVALNVRPDPTTWSALEYIEHIREVFVHSRLACEQALRANGQPYDGPFPPPITNQPADLNLSTVLTALEAETSRNATLFSGLSSDTWEQYAILLDHKWTMRFALTHTLHELLHHLEDAAQSARVDRCSGPASDRA